jgi:hypothetical protein
VLRPVVAPGGYEALEDVVGPGQLLRAVAEA